MRADILVHSFDKRQVTMDSENCGAAYCSSDKTRSRNYDAVMSIAAAAKSIISNSSLLIENNLRAVIVAYTSWSIGRTVSSKM